MKAVFSFARCLSLSTSRYKYCDYNIFKTLNCNSVHKTYLEARSEKALKYIHLNKQPGSYKIAVIIALAIGAMAL